MRARSHRLEGEDRGDGERHHKIARKAPGDTIADMVADAISSAMGGLGVLSGDCHGDSMYPGNIKIR